LDKGHIILVASIIMIPAVLMNQQVLAQNNTYAPFYDRILNYCFDRTEKILADYNPITDLVAAGLIPPHFSNMTCADVSMQAQANLSSAR
jgi:hypothetical protein